jgi:hypothetical protein
MDRPMSGRRTAALGLLLAAVVGIAAIMPRPDAAEEPYDPEKWQCTSTSQAIPFARMVQANGYDEAETVDALYRHGFVPDPDLHRWVCPND